MNWLFLALAGIFEIAFAVSLKMSEGFTKLIPSISFVIFAIISFSLLSQAVKSIPVGTAYAVWTGIGAFGTAIIGICFFNESSSWIRIALLTLLIFSIVGLKLVAMMDA